MEDLSKQLDHLLCKADNLTDFCNIACNEQMKEKLFQLNDRVKRVAEKFAECKIILKENPERIRQMRWALRELRRQEVIMKLVLERSDDGVAEKGDEKDYLVSLFVFYHFQLFLII